MFSWYLLSIDIILCCSDSLLLGLFNILWNILCLWYNLSGYCLWWYYRLSHLGLWLYYGGLNFLWLIKLGNLISCLEILRWFDDLLIIILRCLRDGRLNKLGLSYRLLNNLLLYNWLWYILLILNRLECLLYWLLGLCNHLLLLILLLELLWLLDNILFFDCVIFCSLLDSFYRYVFNLFFLDDLRDVLNIILYSIIISDLSLDWDLDLSSHFFVFCYWSFIRNVFDSWLSLDYLLVGGRDHSLTDFRSTETNRALCTYLSLLNPIIRQLLCPNLWDSLNWSL